MHLEDALYKKAEIEEFLRTLADAHQSILFNDSDTADLDRVRRDIRICFNDLCLLNGIITSSNENGSIKRELARLESLGSKLSKLLDKRTVIEQKQRQWKALVEHKRDWTDFKKSDTLTLKANYHELLNFYVDKVGIEKTSLWDKESDHGELTEARAEFETKELLDRYSLLSLCQSEVDREITQLEAILATFKKDQSFITEERKRTKSRVNSIGSQFQEDLNAVNVSIDKILNKLGLSDEQAGRALRPALLALITRSKESTAVPTPKDIESRISAAQTLLKVQKDALKADVTQYKKDLNRSEHSRNLWDNALSKIQELERVSKVKISSGSDPSLSELMIPMDITITELSGILSEAKSDILTKCLENEKEVLVQARQQIGSRDISVPKHAVRAKSPSFLSGTSPPKTGLNRDFIPITSQMSFQSGNSTTNVGKLKKED
ncbi:LAMI_0H01618g1_1 [Lachancea mirantina]|uniref:LAMI_0H01618g1_1 n=1 Tax=Lachancea mirantina TaxID=1230905 RepID=A0A1G4KE45_9SACH|nr:LAMI_0H01618g1_1 [Lachancea mirantina]